MIQSTLLDFAEGCDLRRLFEAVVDTEAWETVRISAELYAEETGKFTSWNGDGFQGEKTVVLHAGDSHSAWLDLRMDRPHDDRTHFGRGFMILHSEWDFCGYRADLDWSLDTSNRVNRRALESHRRFFEILAREMGMRLTGWGPEGQVWISVERQARMRAREAEA